MRLRRWRSHPEIWLEERFGEDPRALIWENYPEYENHEWDGTKNPLWEAWKSVVKNRHTAVQSATGVGKTYILARIVYWYLDCFENSQVYISAPKEGQLSTQSFKEMNVCFDKFKKIRPYAELTHLKLRVNVKEKKFRESWFAAGFVAGVKAGEESTTKAQGLHGDHMLIITEETPGMPWATMNAFVNTSTGDNNRILAMGNPDNITDPLSMYINRQKSVKVVRISGHDHPNVVTGRNIISGAVSRISLSERRETYGEESHMYKSRGRGIFPEQAKDSLIKFEWIMSCVPGMKQYVSDIPENLDSWNAAGVDVANSDLGDMAAVAYGITNKLVYLKEFQCPNATHLAYNIAYDQMRLQKEGYKNYGIPPASDYGIDARLIGVDSVGVGVATVNAFKDMDWEIQALHGGQNELLIPKDEQERPMYSFVSLRAQMYWLAAQDLLHRRIIIDIDDKSVLQSLAEELVIPKVKITGKAISVDSKEDIKKRMAGKSPNLSDAFVYWNYARRAANMEHHTYMPLGS